MKFKVLTVTILTTVVIISLINLCSIRKVDKSDIDEMVYNIKFSEDEKNTEIESIYESKKENSKSDLKDIFGVVDKDRTASFIPTSKEYAISDWLKTKCKLLIPSKIYITNSNVYWLYDNCLLANYDNVKNYGVYLDAVPSDNSALYLKCNEYAIIGGSDCASIELVVKTFMDETISYRKGATTLEQKHLIVRSKKTTSGRRINTLFIGDSYFAYSASNSLGILGYIKKYFDDKGNTLVGKGTHMSCGILAEAKGGWTETDFYSNENSPFVFNENFDFGQYLSTNNISNVDNIVFHLGMNGGNGEDIQNMITNIKLSVPNVKIFVCTVPCGQVASIPSNDWYHDIVGTQRIREIQNESYLEKFDNRVDENIIIIPIHLSFNREYGLISKTYEVARFSGVTKNGFSNHHPSNSGEQEIAFMIYNYLDYFN